MDGCPEGVMENYDHRVSAAALRRRGLVTTRGRGPTWTAAATEEGRKFLARSKEPNAPKPRQANLSVTQQLVADVVAAGGTLTIPKEPGGGGVDYLKRAAAAERHGRVPEGKRIEARWDYRSGSYVVSLVEGFKPPEGLDPIVVPEKVSRYHPVVRQFRDDRDRHEVTKAQLPRVLRVLQALVVGAENQGFSVSNVGEPEGRRTYLSWTGPRDGHICLTKNGHSEALRVHEDGLPSRAWWEQQHRTWSSPYSFGGKKEKTPAPGYEEKATGRIVLNFVGYARFHRPSSWGDSARKSLEDQLPLVLFEAEARLADEEAREREAERKAELRRVKWEEAVAKAKLLFLDSRCAEILENDVDLWERATRIRAYCDAVEAEFPGEVTADPDTRDQVAWARRHADRLDPLDKPPRPPLDPEHISGEDLRPFLRGWDPYRPGN